MKTKKAHSIFLILTFLLTAQVITGQKKSEAFQFNYEGKMLHGLIESPTDVNPSAIILIIPGFGKTNFVKGGWYTELRNKFIEAGLAVCFWDKMGCGDSEGVFDAQQPVKSSAKEALAALEELKKRKDLDSLKVGMWGISRAGFICPLIMEQHPVDFWISVSGTDDKETFNYLLKSNLLVDGKSEEEAQFLYEAWMKGHKIFCTGGTYESFVEATLPLQKDTSCQRLFGYSTETSKEDKKIYYSAQKNTTSDGYFDTKSGLWVYLKNFDITLSKIDCPVLAIFGEKDYQVDWKKTKKYYENTIGKNPKAKLTIKTLPNCNHNIQKCDDCGINEDLSKYDWQACDGYYDIMQAWLKEMKITK